jgi:hypothetical protein
MTIGDDRSGVDPHVTLEPGNMQCVSGIVVQVRHGELELPHQPRTHPALHRHDPGVRFRDIAVEVDITERRAHGIVADLVDAGYLVKQKTGRRNRYRIQAHLPLRDSVTRERTIGERTIGEMLDVLVGANPGSREHTPGRVHDA